jgi:hypothetical protein
MRYLFLLFLLVACTKQNLHEKYIYVISPLNVSECFLYPTYPSYETIFKVNQIERNKKVYIVIKAETDCSIKYSTKNDNEMICGMRIKSNNSTSEASYSQDDLIGLEKTDCSNMGKIIKRNE